MDELVLLQDSREPNPEIDAGHALFTPREYVHASKGAPGYLRPIPVRRAHLATGDYSLPGLDHLVTIERKTLPDLLGTLYGTGQDSTGNAAPERVRFLAQMQRMGTMIWGGGRAWIVVEASELDVRRWNYRSRTPPPSVLGDLDAIAVDFGVPTLWAGDRAGAERMVGSMLGRIWSLHVDASKAAEAARRGRDVFMPWLHGRTAGEQVA